MTRRISRVVALVGATAALMVGGVGISQASNGADDPTGHHREHHPRHHHHHITAGITTTATISATGPMIAATHGRDDGPRHQ